MSALRFYLVLPFSLLPALGWHMGSSWLSLIVAFLFIPLVDQIVGTDERNPDESQVARTFWYDLALFLYVPLHFGLIVWGAWAASKMTELGTQLHIAVAVGVATGSLGITIAHELGHRRSGVYRFVSQLLLTGVCYGHFYIEHNRGHHVRVATPDDPASAQMNQNFYAFWLRSVVAGFVSACHLEAAWLHQRRLPVWSWHNRIVWYIASSAALGAALQALFGWVAVQFFVTQAIIAFTLLELVNYVEHYGLARQRDKARPDRYERVNPTHSWNDSHIISNAFLINLQRHSDHHANPSRPYPVLRHFNESPQLPAGYPLMVLIALVPPLWFAVMNPRVARWRNSISPETVESPQ